MKIINARLRHQEALYTLDLQDGVIKSISAQTAKQAADASDIDAQQKLVIPPFVEPHIHLDATLTAGEPEWNMSGTLFEGIARKSLWSAGRPHKGSRQPVHSLYVVKLIAFRRHIKMRIRRYHHRNIPNLCPDRIHQATQCG